MQSKLSVYNLIWSVKEKLRKYRAMKTCYVSVSQIVVRGGPQAISEEKVSQKLYDT
jgi:hypothetical protein